MDASPKTEGMHSNTIQYNALQYNAMQYKYKYNTMHLRGPRECIAIQYNTMHYNTMQCNTSTNTIQCISEDRGNASAWLTRPPALAHLCRLGRTRDAGVGSRLLSFRIQIQNQISIQIQNQMSIQIQPPLLQNIVKGCQWYLSAPLHTYRGALNVF